MLDVWILGAGGRCGSAIAEELSAKQVSTVLVGRDATNLQQTAAKLAGTSRIVVADSLVAIKAALARSGPVVVANFIGPFTETAVPIARACAPGSGYLDLSNELFANIGILELTDESAASNRCLVTGAGFGFLATESVVLKLCEHRTRPAKVRVDALPFVDSPGLIGPTVAASVVESLPIGGRIFENGRLTRASPGSYFEQFVLPDGSMVGTGSMPTGDLVAAHRASRAPFVVAASSMVPGSPILRALLPAAAALFALRPLREFAKQRIARINVPPAKGDRKRSWAHVKLEWEDGTNREGWLRAGEAMDFTTRTAAEVAYRLARSEGRPGAFTPGALFGCDLALRAGGEFLLS